MTIAGSRYERVLRTLLLAFPGPELPEQTKRWLDDGLAGIVLFARNITSQEQLTELCAQIRELNPDAIIALDEEGGEVTRLQSTSGSSWPGARALGTIDDPQITRLAGMLTGEALARVGATVNFAPVADVDIDGRYVFATRTFSSSPLKAAAHVRAFIDGTQAAGVAACAKHFPGHGGTDVDSHLSMPVIASDRRVLLRDHLPPFAAAIEADVAMLMAAHVRYPRIDALAATVSTEILTAIARDELGFGGVVITDALEMGAIAEQIGVSAAASAALRAGADLLCLCSGLDLQREVVASLDAALAGGELGAERLEQASARVARLASRYRGVARAGAAPRDLDAIFAQAQAAGLEVAQRALRTAPLPPPLSAPPYVIELTTRVTGVGDTRARLTDALARRDDRVRGTAYAADAIPDAAAVIADAAGRPIVIATRDAVRHEHQRELVEAVVAARPETLVVGLGLPADAALAPGRFIAALGAAPPNLTAVAEVLLP